MKFSIKFLLATLLILVFFVVSNVVALKHYASIYFTEYLEEVKVDTSEIDIAFIESILKNEKLDPELVQEYKEITRDLTRVSTSLENFSKDPKPIQK